MTEHLFARILDAKEKLTPVQSQYRVVFEVPMADFGSYAGVLVPDPNWLAMALAGGYLPPVEAVVADLGKMYAWCADNDPLDFDWDKVGGVCFPYLPPIGAMTEEQAIEALVMICLPPAIWADYGRANRHRFKIVRRGMVPDDRSYRNAWRLAA